MKTIRLDERDLQKMINDAVRKVLRENAEYDNDLDEQDVDADSYYGGGLPERKPEAHTTTYEREFSEIYGKVKPYITRLSFLLNNNDIDRETYDKVMDALDTLDSLPSIGKNLTSTEIDTD